MDVREADLMGIGKKYQIKTDQGEELIVVIHDDGRRELYSYDANEGESRPVMTLSDNDARQVAGIIGGLTYTPKSLPNLEVELHDLVIEWYKLPAGAFAIGKSIGDLDVRKNSGSAIIAAVHDSGTVINPGPEYLIQHGTTIVAAGRREQIATLHNLLLGTNNPA